MIGSTHQSTKEVEDSIDRLNKNLQDANKQSTSLNKVMLGLTIATVLLTLVQVIYLFTN